MKNGSQGKQRQQQPSARASQSSSSYVMKRRLSSVNEGTTSDINKSRMDELPRRILTLNMYNHLPIKETNLNAIAIASELEEQKKERQPIGRLFDAIISKAFDIVERYMSKHGAVLFGGTAFNLIVKSLPQTLKRKHKAVDRYIRLESNEQIDINLTVDYDIFIANGKYHAERICELLHEAGLPNVEGSTNLHYGTYKIYVDYVPLVDVHSFPDELFPVLQKEAHKYKLSTLYPSVPHPNLELYVASPDFLRMEIYKELAKPNDNPGRWKKLTTRLSILNRYFTISNKMIRDSGDVASGKNRVCKLKDGNSQQCVGDRASEMRSLRQDFAAALGKDLVTQKQADDILKGVYLEAARYISKQKLILTGMTALASFVRSRVSVLNVVRMDSFPLNMPPVDDMPDYDVYASGPPVGFVSSGQKRTVDDVPLGQIHARKLIDILEKKLIFIVRDALGKDVEDAKLHRVAQCIRFAQCNYGVITDILPPHSMVTLVAERSRGNRSNAKAFPKFTKAIIDIYHDSVCTGYVQGNAIIKEDGSTLPFRIGSVATLLQLWFTWLFLADPKLDMGSGNKDMLATCPRGKFRREHKKAKIICAIEYMLENQTHMNDTPFSIFSRECDTDAMKTGGKPGTSGEDATGYREQIRQYRAIANKWRWTAASSAQVKKRRDTDSAAGSAKRTVKKTSFHK